MKYNVFFFITEYMYVFNGRFLLLLPLKNKRIIYKSIPLGCLSGRYLFSYLSLHMNNVFLNTALSWRFQQYNVGEKRAPQILIIITQL
jgi:hypothetical protein